MVTDTGKTIENPKEYLRKQAEESSKRFKKTGKIETYCTTTQICPECGAVLYDSPCFHFFTDCPRCGYHKEPSWKSTPVIDTTNLLVTVTISQETVDDFNMKYQG